MGKAAKAEAAGDGIYNDLSFDEQETYDRIAANGYRPVQNGLAWVAEPMQGDGAKIGPWATLDELETAVIAITLDDPPNEEIEEIDATGDEAEDDGFRLDGEASDGEKKGKTHKVRQPLLPNTQNAVVEDLRSAILGYRATTMDIIEYQARQKDEKKLVLALMHKFEDELSVDRETGEKFFQVQTIRCYLEIKETENLRTEAVSNA